MKKFILLLLPTLFVFGMKAQKAEARPFSEGSDPNAKASLEKVRSVYEGYESLELDFTIVVEFGEESEEQTGTAKMKGKKYKIDLENQMVVSNEKTMWIFLKDMNEVQITNPDPDDTDNLMSPSNLLRIYEKEDEFIYAITNEVMENGKMIQQIEFKPKDRDVEYSKIRVSLDKNSSKIKHIKVFGKDGMRYTLRIDKMNTQSNLTNSDFYFDTSLFEGIHVENLTTE